MVAGAASLRREVVWCAALRARPPAFEPLRGGELLLVDLQVLKAFDSRLALAGLLASLGEQAVAGVAVRGPIPEAARRLAEASALPLFALPVGAPVDQVEQRVLRYIVDRRAELHEQAQDLHRQLSELALAGRGLRALLARLNELTGVAVLLERDAAAEYVADGRERAVPGPIADVIRADRPALDQWLREVPLSAFDPPVATRPLPGGLSRLVAPVLAQGSIAGFLSLIGSEGELGELHRLAVGRAAHACAIELARAGAARDARDEVEDELLDVLTAARPGSQEAAFARAKRKGFDLEAPYLVVAAEAERSGKALSLRTAWERQLGTMRLPALVRDREEFILAMVSLAGRQPPDVRALLDQLHRAARSAAGPVGLGHAAIRSGTAAVAGAAREAEQALRMGRRLYGPDALTAFADLGLYRFLYALEPLPELRAFRDEMLARLRQKDRGGVLLPTLAAYLATNGSPTDAAQRLHLHRNTVLYRLGRIEEILGSDLRDADVRVTLHLALKIDEVLEPVAGRARAAPGLDPEAIGA
jgi:purine catabolism regulator